MSSSCESEETLSPWLPSSPMIGPAIVTESSAGITVMNGASTDRKIQEQQDEDMKNERRRPAPAGVPRRCCPTALLVNVDGELARQVDSACRSGQGSGGGDGRAQVLDQIGHRALVALRHVGQHLNLRRLTGHPVRAGHGGLAKLADLRHRRHLGQVGLQRAKEGLVGGAERPGGDRRDDGHRRDRQRDPKRRGEGSSRARSARSRAGTHCCCPA